MEQIERIAEIVGRKITDKLRNDCKIHLKHGPMAIRVSSCGWLGHSLDDGFYEHNFPNSAFYHVIEFTGYHAVYTDRKEPVSDPTEPRCRCKYVLDPHEPGCPADGFYSKK